MIENICVWLMVILLILKLIDMHFYKKSKNTNLIGVCRKCKYYVDGFCIKNNVKPSEGWFCSYFEKK